MFPVFNSVSNLVRGTLSSKWILTSAAAAAFALPGVAQAHDRYDHDDYGRDRVGVSIRIGEPAPRFEERRVQVWVAPVYRTVCDRQWIEPVYRTECQQVLVPDVFENREVRYRDHWGRTVCRTERVLVTPAHYEKRDVQVLVCAGRFVNVERQEIVCAGHYETRVERVACGPSPVGVVNPGLASFGFHFGR
jgi:hypothetical protein